MGPPQSHDENRLPANDTSAIGSPVKVIKLEAIDSPHFRPAHTVALTQGEEQQGERPRKSMGRRVSFAATAHVRVYEKPAQPEADPQQHEVAEDVFVSRQIVEEEEGDDMSLTEPSPPRARPLAAPPLVAQEARQHSPQSPASNGSFEVEVKDSHSSFGSVETETLHHLDDDMDLTQCIGRIISEAEDHSMDLTTCVGGILRTLPHVLLSSPAASVSSVDTMELTMCLGGILEGAGTREASVAVCAKDAALQGASPSPFLVQSPQLRRLESPAACIADTERPEAFNYASIMSPRPPRHDDDLFQTFMNADKLEDDFGRGEPAASDRPQSPSTENPVSYAESPTVTLILPRASLKDFLNETGVRFLDNLSSLTRRETTGRPRDSDIMTLARQAFIASTLVPESDVYDTACEDLVALITQAKEQVAQQESHFNHSPPLAFLQWHRETERREAVVVRMKTLKSVGRLMAKHSWYQWRLGIHAPLNSVLESNLERLRAENVLVLDTKAVVDQAIAAVAPQLKVLTNELHRHHMQQVQRQRGDYEQSKSLSLLLAEQHASVAACDAALVELAEQERQLRAAIDAAVAEKSSLQARIAAARSACSTAPECTLDLVQELKSAVALHQAVTAWHIESATDSRLTLRYLRGDLAIVFLRADAALWDGAVVSEHSTNPLLKHASHVVAPVRATLPQALLELCTALDRLSSLERQLSAIALPSHAVLLVNGRLCIRLAVFSAAAKAKFDIDLVVGERAIEYGGFVGHYGPVEERDVVDAVKIHCLQKQFSLKKVVAAVADVASSFEP